MCDIKTYYRCIFKFTCTGIRTTPFSISEDLFWHYAARKSAEDMLVLGQGLCFYSLRSLRFYWFLIRIMRVESSI
jgi:hypothetical protein